MTDAYLDQYLFVRDADLDGAVVFNLHGPDLTNVVLFDAVLTNAYLLTMLICSMLGAAIADLA